MHLPHGAAPATIAKDLVRLVESEELGESLFATAAQLSTSDRARHSWHALQALEVQTKAGVHRFLERSGLAIKPTNRLAAAAGTLGATGLRLLPERARLSMIRQGTGRYLPAFKRLVTAYAHTDEAEFFDYVVRHELAIIAYTEGALADRPDALDPVLRLLDRQQPI